MTEQASARELFRAAYDNRYTWDKNFPGYSADITLKRGNELFTAKARINADLKFEVTDVSDEQAKEEIRSQVWEIAVHRVRRPFEDTHGQNTFTLGEMDATGAVEILVGGKATGDRYKVQNNVVSLVHRRIHNVVVTINTFSTIDTGEGYLSHSYDSVYHDPETGEQKGGRSEFEDEYTQVGDYFILTRRVIRTETPDGLVTADFGFSNVKLLEPAAV